MYIARYKGQLNSEWKYEVIVSPKFPTKNYKDFCPGSLLEGRAEISVIFGWDLGETMTSYNHSEFNWPLAITTSCPFLFHRPWHVHNFFLGPEELDVKFTKIQSVLRKSSLGIRRTFFTTLEIKKWINFCLSLQHTKVFWMANNNGGRQNLCWHNQHNISWCLIR